MKKLHAICLGLCDQEMLLPSGETLKGYRNFSSANWLNHHSLSLFIDYSKIFIRCLLYAISPSRCGGNSVPVLRDLAHPVQPPSFGKLGFTTYYLSWPCTQYLPTLESLITK